MTALTVPELEAKLSAAEVVATTAKATVRAEQARRRRAEEQYDELVERLGRFGVAELYRRTDELSTSTEASTPPATT